MGTPEYTGYDPRKPAAKGVGLVGAIEQFIAEMPEGTKALNLGCGQSRLENMVNVDWMADDAVDVACDLFAPGWPFEDDSIGFVYMSHLLEHVPGHVWGTFWSELWRIVADGGRIMIVSPHARSDRFLQDPTHCQPLIDRKFNYLNKRWRVDNKLNHGYYGGKDLNFLMDIRPWKMWHQDYAMREDSVKFWAELHENNVIDDQIWFLRAFKSEESLQAFIKAMEAEMQGQIVQGRPVGTDA